MHHAATATKSMGIVAQGRRSLAMMNDYGASMGFGWIGILLFLILIGLIIAALIKYLRS